MNQDETTPLLREVEGEQVTDPETRSTPSPGESLASGTWSYLDQQEGVVQVLVRPDGSGYCLEGVEHDWETRSAGWFTYLNPWTWTLLPFTACCGLRRLRRRQCRRCHTIIL